jgi:hypothetical protein
MKNTIADSSRQTARMYHAPMHNFFHGWRPKAGCVTLVMACVLIVGWIKSIWFQDEIEFYCGSQSLVSLQSVDQLVTWDSYHGRAVHDVLCFPVWQSGAKGGVYTSANVVIDWQWYDFTVGNIPFEGTSDHVTFWRFPYWAIAIPLTLLSAYLILWKPRTRG